MKRLIHVLAALALATFAAAADPIPDIHKPNGGSVPWLVGSQVGVPGGIPSAAWPEYDLTTLGVSTGNSREANSAALMAAVNTYKNGAGAVLRLPAGTFNFNPISLNNIRKLAIRGAGMFQTTVDASSIFFGASFPGPNSPSFNPTGTAVSGFTRGSTTITVTDNGNGIPFRANDFIRYVIPNDSSLNMRMYSWVESLLSAQNYATAVTNNGGGSWTITLQIPIPRNYNGTITVEQPQPFFSGGGMKFSGIEDFTLNSSGAPQGVSWQGMCVGIWAKNIRVTNVNNYPFFVNETVGSTVTGCFVQKSTGWGPSHMAILVNAESNGVLVEDSIFWQNYAGFGIQQSSNIVFSHNFILDCPVYGSTNHASFPHHNALEGNVVTGMNTDGYHGGSATTLIHRNWLYAVAVPDTGSLPRPELTWNTTTGLPTNGSASYGFAAKRWTYDYAIIKNIAGTPGYVGSGQINLDGQPNIGNGFSYGYATYSGTASTAFARSSDSVGTITAQTGHGITTGQTIKVYWGSYDGSFAHSHLRVGVIVGTVSGNTIPISGGNGDALPAGGTTVYVPTSNTSIIAYPQDWNGLTNRPHTWTAEVTAITPAVSATLNFTGGNVTVAGARAARAVDNFNPPWWSFQKISSTPSFAFANYFQGGGYISGSTLVANFIADWPDYPTVGTVVNLGPSAYGFQELDLDVRALTTARGNRNYNGTPTLNDFLVGETTYPSYVYASAPGFLAGYSFPVFEPDSIGTLSVRRLPAGDRFMTFLETGSFDGTAVATPQFSPAPGTYPAGTSVTITTQTTGATIRVTVDGSTPTTGSPTYTIPLTPSVGTTVVKSFAVKAGLTDSAVQSGTYILVNVPTAPSSLTATAINDTQINLAWTDNSSTETSFRIERKIGAGAWSTLATTAAGATTYSDIGLTALTTYDYRVFAVNVAGDSTASNTASGTTLSSGGVPTAPSSLSATAFSSSQINLAWTDNSSNETGFRIERKIGAGTWGAITTVAVNATSYSNIELTPATTYDYRVFAVNGVGDSTVSNTATATTPAGGGGGGPSGTATIGTLNINTMNIQ